MTNHTTRQVPKALYRADQVREFDRVAIEEHAIPGWALMQRAGRAAFRLLRKKWPQARRIAVVCGTGNNAGDGYVVARDALEAGYRVEAFSVAPSSKLRGDALMAYSSYCDRGGAVSPYAADVLDGFEVVVDALLGTGLDREVEGLFANAIEAINAFPGGVLALDIPSGLNADTGCRMGTAVRADQTVTFIALKRGLFTGEAADHCGEISFAALDVPESVFAGAAPSAVLLDLSDPLPPKRERCAHKGSFGHVLVVGGEAGFSGAARLAAEAAARIGAGLVSVATRKAHAGYLNMDRPELMCHGVESQSDLAPLLARATAVAIGPGLGQSAWGSGLFGAAIASGLPIVVDADALNLLAQDPRRHENWVLTPHPGEAARLLGSSVFDVQRDRFAAASALQRGYGGVAVLKGSGTLICENQDDPISICQAGNPGMASGGMGDVLTGVIAGLIAQRLPLGSAAKLGVCLHAQAADLAAAEGERGLLASDLMLHLRRLANQG